MVRSAVAVAQPAERRQRERVRGSARGRTGGAGETGPGAPRRPTAGDHDRGHRRGARSRRAARRRDRHDRSAPDDRPRPPTTTATSRSQARPASSHVRADFAGFKQRGARSSTSRAGGAAKLDFALATAPLLNETIVVVGSRTPRTNVETTVPVDVITTEEIARSGRTETGRDPATSWRRRISRCRRRSPTAPTTSIPASLRGLGPDQVLVLVNGKRRHRSALLQHQRHVRPRHGRHRSQRDSRRRDQADRDPARRRRVAVRLRRDRRRDQHRDQGRHRPRRHLERGRHHRVARRRRSSRARRTTASRSARRASSTSPASSSSATRRTAAASYTGPVLLERPGDGRRAARASKRAHPQGLRDADRRGRRRRRDGRVRHGAADVGRPRRSTASAISSHRRGDAGGFYRFPVQDDARTSPQFYPNGFLPLILPTMDDNAVTVGMRTQGRRGTSTRRSRTARARSSSTSTTRSTRRSAPRARRRSTPARSSRPRPSRTSISSASSTRRR